MKKMLPISILRNVGLSVCVSRWQKNQTFLFTLYSQMVKFKEKAEIFLRFRFSTSPCNASTRGIQTHTAEVPARTMAACLPVCCSLDKASAFFWQVKSGRLLFLRETDRRKVFWWRTAPACRQNAIIHNNGAVHNARSQPFPPKFFQGVFEWIEGNTRVLYGSYMGPLFIHCHLSGPKRSLQNIQWRKKGHMSSWLWIDVPTTTPPRMDRAALLMCWPNIDFSH